MKTAVVYFYLEGNTKLIAEKISEKLGADIIELKPVKPYPTKGIAKFFQGGKGASLKEKTPLQSYSFNADDYDTVIVGNPLWAWALTPPLRTFLSENDLSDKRVAAFICCSGGDASKALAAIKAETKHDSLAAELILTDPLKNSAGIDEKISGFCKKLGKE